MLILQPISFGAGPYSPEYNVKALRRLTECRINDPSDDTVFAGRVIRRHIMVSAFCIITVCLKQYTIHHYLWASDTATGFAMPIFEVSLLNLSNDAIASAIRFCVARFNSSFSLTNTVTHMSARAITQQSDETSTQTHTGKLP